MDGPLLALDLGARRIGLAISDADASIAFPIGALASHGRKKDLAAVAALVLERGVKGVVVGLPLHMDGHAGPEAEAARRFAAELGEATGLPVELIDERWTSVEAERALRFAPRKQRRRKQEIDALAATLILRSFLDRAKAAR